MKKLLVILILAYPAYAETADQYYERTNREDEIRRIQGQYQADRDMYFAQQRRQNELLEEQNEILRQAENNRAFDRLERNTERLKQENERDNNDIFGYND